MVKAGLATEGEIDSWQQHPEGILFLSDLLLLPSSTQCLRLIARRPYCMRHTSYRDMMLSIACPNITSKILNIAFCRWEEREDCWTLRDLIDVCFWAGAMAEKADDSMVELDLTGGNVSPSTKHLSQHDSESTPQAKLAPTSDDDFASDGLLALGGLDGDA